MAGNKNAVVIDSAAVASLMARRCIDPARFSVRQMESMAIFLLAEVERYLETRGIEQAVRAVLKSQSTADRVEARQARAARKALRAPRWARGRKEAR